ncbi:hypothetical protein MBLNU457_4189t1 [Dothideomycetes sp. NU457]
MPSKKRNHRSSTSGTRETEAKQAKSAKPNNGNDESSAAGTNLRDFVKWAESIDIELNGAAPKTIPGAGTGLVTTRHVKQGEVIVHVPRDCMMNPLFSVPGLFDGENEDGKGKEELSPQAQLAVTLNAARKLSLAAAEDEQSDDSGGVGEWYKQCSRHWPSKQDFEKCLLWLPPRLAPATDSDLPSIGGDALENDDTDTIAGLRELLPSSTRNPLERLEKDLAKDKAAFKALLASRPEHDSDGDDMAAFEYHWTLTNTRSFFWKPAGTKKGCMVMCPVLDFVNHTSHASNLACEVASTAEGYTLKANRDYKTGEEIYACYGAHSNDKLLVHYGFILSDNKDDSLPLSPIIMPHLTPTQLSALRDVGYEGNYSLDPSIQELCFRTQVAVRSVLLTANEWEFFMSSGEDIGVDMSGEVTEWVKQKVREWLVEAKETIGKVYQMNHVETRDTVTARLGLVMRRWAELIEGFKQWVAE